VQVLLSFIACFFYLWSLLNSRTVRDIVTNFRGSSYDQKSGQVQKWPYREAGGDL